MDEKIDQIINFLKEIEKFKHIERDILYTGAARKENDAEHVWHMIMFLWLFKDKFPKNLNFDRMLKMTLVHDLPEIYAGDVSMVDEVGKIGKKEREMDAAVRLFSQLGPDLRDEFMDLYKEYSDGETQEAKYVKSIDKIQPILQIICSSGETWKRQKFSYDLIDSYKRKYCEHDPFLLSLYERLMTEAKNRNMFG